MRLDHDPLAQKGGNPTSVIIDRQILDVFPDGARNDESWNMRLVQRF
jgi:hypothetical protein